jgi:hypothetical protein
MADNDAGRALCAGSGTRPGQARKTEQSGLGPRMTFTTCAVCGFSQRVGKDGLIVEHRGRG